MCRVFGIGVLASGLIYLVGCGGGGGGSNPASGGAGGGAIRSVSGTVWLPAEVSAANSAADTAGAPVAGLVPAPDGTVIRAEQVDSYGTIEDLPAMTTTSGGGYSIHASGLRPTAHMLVSADTGSGHLRAVVVGSRADIDPISEAIVRMVLKRGSPLDALTSKELGDLYKRPRTTHHVARACATWHC